MTPKSTSELTLLDPSKHILASSNKINITLDIDFVHCPCQLLAIEYQDMMGTSVANVFSSKDQLLRKYVIDSYQQVIGEWVDEEKEEITVSQIVESINSRQGCRINGLLEVYKAPGSIRMYPNPQLSD